MPEEENKTYLQACLLETHWRNNETEENIELQLIRSDVKYEMGFYSGQTEWMYN